MPNTFCLSCLKRRSGLHGGGETSLHRLLIVSRVSLSVEKHTCSEPACHRVLCCVHSRGISAQLTCLQGAAAGCLACQWGCCPSEQLPRYHQVGGLGGEHTARCSAFGIPWLSLSELSTGWSCPVRLKVLIDLVLPI